MKQAIFYIFGIMLIFAAYLTVGDEVMKKTQNNTREVMPAIKIEEPKEDQKTVAQTSTTPVKSVHLPILMYHYIRTVTDLRDPVGIDLSVPASMFEEQMKYLDNAGYTTITLDDLVATWKGEKTLPEKPIIMTFDDGYEDFYTVVFPILKKYNLKATAYIIAGFIDKPHYLTSEQLKELSQSPLVTIAAHTMQHPNLRNTTGPKLIDEVMGSKKWLENFTEKTILHFAYPSGQYNKETIRAVEKAGYITSVTTEPGEDHPSTKPFAITRVRIRGAVTLEAFQKLLP